jgi:hypothetical protein
LALSYNPDSKGGEEGDEIVWIMQNQFKTIYMKTKIRYKNNEIDWRPLNTETTA